MTPTERHRVYINTAPFIESETELNVSVLGMSDRSLATSIVYAKLVGMLAAFISFDYSSETVQAKLDERTAENLDRIAKGAN